MSKGLGYWATHNYKRRAVERDIKGFVGWNRILELASKFHGSKVRRNRALYSATFLTGGRIGEVLELKTENFDVDQNEVTVKQMRLFKRYEKLGEYLEWVDEKPDNKLARLFKHDDDRDSFYRKRYNTKTVEEFRTTFSFPVNEPLAPFLVNWLRARDGWLFPGYSKTHLSYSRAYQIISDIGIYPHWLRGQRASCIISYYGLSMEEMMEWMGWEELTTARHYGKFGKKALTSKMMGKSYPSDALELQKEML